MLPIQENSVIDFEGFASEFGEDEGPLMDLGQGDQAPVEAKAVETPVVEQSETPEGVEGVEQPVAEEVVQENAPEAPQAFQFKYNNQDYEVNVDQIVELNNGYLRQEDYTKKLQWWGGWFQQHQNEVGFVQNLNKFFTLRPEKAEFFYKHVLNDEPVQGQPAQTQTPGTEKTVQELLAEPQVQQQPQQQQISPEVAHLYNVVAQQQQQLKAQNEWREDYQLDQRLNLARQKYGDFDENSVLKWMYHLKTEDPEVAINRMIAEAWTAQARQGAGQQRPQQQQQVQQPQVQQPAPHIEGGGKGRGVAAAQNGAKQPAQTYPNWSAAQQALLQSGIF